MPGKAVGLAAVELPWLCPNTESLIGLADAPADLSRLSAADPALLAFLLRFGPSDRPFTFTPRRFHSPVLLETAIAYLTRCPGCWPSPATFVVGKLGAVANQAASLARRLAEQSRRVNADDAAAVARLAPLGWYAVAAVDPFAAAEPLFDADCQKRLWGLDHDAITRRLAGRWRLPAWVATVIGHLNLPFAAARAFTTDPDLFAVVQLAVNAAEKQTTNLGLTTGADRDQLLAHLGLSREGEAPAEPSSSENSGSAGALSSQRHDPYPHRVPLLVSLLRHAADARRRNGATLVVRLEEQIDHLTHALAETADGVAAKVQTAKLAALAELAGGAGHEINNPLAVIVGHAQRLLRSEPDRDREESLRAILRQTDRIAGLLRDLMQFARPPRPEPRTSPVSEILLSVREQLQPVAGERDVRLELVGVPADVAVTADAKQLRHALGAIVRNGIEAAGADGWVRLSCETIGGQVRFVVEDSGPGLTNSDVEHAFDPFYSGRSAGRGRGLGLPTAWQLVRQNGGEVRHEPLLDGPTRFVVELPITISVEKSDRRSA